MQAGFTSRQSGGQRLLRRLRRRARELAPAVDRAREVLRFASRRGAALKLDQVAASLTFTTVLALVPLLTVALAVFTAFPLFGEFRAALERNLLASLLPETYASVILRNLNAFAGKATRLGAAGLAVLAFTALMMVMTVDRVLNDIWDVRERRPLVPRLVVYWALLTIGPVVAGASLTLTSWLASASAGLVDEVPGTLRRLAGLAPVLLGGLGWTVLYVIVPNRRVGWGDAAVGGFIAAGLGEILSRGFAGYIAKGSTLTIYGAFAVVPIFLAWLYLSWLVVLFGASVAATLPMLRSTRFADRHRAGDDFVTAAALLLELLARRSQAPPGEAGTATLARAVRCFEEDARARLRVLEQLGYVRELAGRGRGEAGTWIAVCDPGRATMGPLFRRLAVDPDLTLLARHPCLAAWIADGASSAWLATPLERLVEADPGTAPGGTAAAAGAGAAAPTARPPGSAR